MLDRIVGVQVIYMQEKLENTWKVLEFDFGKGVITLCKGNKWLSLPLSHRMFAHVHTWPFHLVQEFFKLVFADIFVLVGPENDILSTYDTRCLHVLYDRQTKSDPSPVTFILEQKADMFQ